MYRTVDDPEVGECNQLLIPESLKSYVLEIMHNLSGHQGIERTYALLKKRCYWLNMLIDIKTWIQNCERCLLSKNPLPRVRTSMGSLTASKPLQIVAIDFTFLEKSSDGRENVLIMTDVFFVIYTSNTNERSTCDYCCKSPSQRVVSSFGNT